MHMVHWHMHTLNRIHCITMQGNVCTTVDQRVRHIVQTELYYSYARLNMNLWQHDYPQ